MIKKHDKKGKETLWQMVEPKKTVISAGLTFPKLDPL